MLFSILAAGLFLGGEPATGCSLDRATYRDTADAGFTMAFAETDEADRMILTSSTTSARYAFSMNEGNGYSTTALAPVRMSGDRTLGPIFAYAIRDDLDASGDFPALADAAPPYLFVPELGRLLWYQGETLGGPSLVSGIRESLPRVFFKLSDCATELGSAP